MKRIENSNVRGVRTQGIVRAACIIHTSTALFLVGESQQTRAAGFRAAGGFFSRSGCSADCFAPSSLRI